MKRELKDVLHYYLPYKVEMTTTAKGRSAYITTIKRRLKKVEILTIDLYDVMIFLRRKPILHPLSFVNDSFLDKMSFQSILEVRELRSRARTLDSIHFVTLKECLKNHIDIFGLIESGQAIEKTKK